MRRRGQSPQHRLRRSELLMSFDRPSYSLRAALLGGAAFETSVAPVSAAATTAQAPAGPASFADVVDRVKPAVVSVKVKLSEDASDEQAERPHMPDFAPGSPL